METQQRSTLGLLTAVSLLALLLLSASPPAWADAILDLTVPNVGLSGFPAPYGQVDVHLTDSTHATITFSADTTGGFTYLFGAAQALDVNVNAASFTVSGISVASLSNGGANNADGFGQFNLTLDNFDGFLSAFSTGSFTLTDTSGTWASAADVLTPNAAGSLAAAHIFVSGSNCAGSPCTGFATDGLLPTPEPSTLLLFGSALVGLGGIARRRRPRPQ